LHFFVARTGDYVYYDTVTHVRSVRVGLETEPLFVLFCVSAASRGIEECGREDRKEPMSWGATTYEGPWSWPAWSCGRPACGPGSLPGRRRPPMTWPRWAPALMTSSRPATPPTRPPPPPRPVTPSSCAGSISTWPAVSPATPKPATSSRI